MGLTEWIDMGTKFLNYVFGISNVDTGEMLIYRLLTLLLVGWICLFGFMLIRKSSLLKNWKVPHLANLTLIILISICGAVISYLFVSNFNLFILLIDNVNESVSFLSVILFMVLYISIGLEMIHQKVKNKTKEEFIPHEMGIFVSRSIVLAFGLVMIEFAQIIIINFLGKAPQNLAILTTTPFLVDKIFGAVFSILILSFGLLICFMAFSQEKTRKRLKVFEGLMKRNPRIIFLTMFGLLFILSVKYFFQRNFKEGIPVAILSLLMLITSIFIKKIVRFLRKIKEKKSSKTKDVKRD